MDFTSTCTWLRFCYSALLCTCTPAESPDSLPEVRAEYRLCVSIQEQMNCRRKGHQGQSRIGLLHHWRPVSQYPSVAPTGSRQFGSMPPPGS